MPRRDDCERILIVGGGFAGLALAARLAQAGLPVTLLEAASRVGDQASTRNQGWLHSGAFFALDHPQLARWCYQSLRQTLAFCPEAIEPGLEGMLYVASRLETRTTAWTRAWDEAGIPYVEVPHNEALELLAGVDPGRIQRVFRLPDRAFRPDVLLEALAAQARNAGVEIRLQTPVTRLLSSDGATVGVVTGRGEEIRGCRVVLATGVLTSELAPWLLRPPSGTQPGYSPVIIKIHLVATHPELSRVPFCVLDAEGFNHLPHLQTSVFGNGSAPVVANPHDTAVERSAVDRLWQQVEEFFPAFDREEAHNVREWAGTTLQMLHVDQVTPGRAPLPTVINHHSEVAPGSSVWSIHPGRATLWAQVAEQARDRLLNDLNHREPITATPPPWHVAS